METLKTDTDLVTVPVIATDRERHLHHRSSSGRVCNLRKTALQQQIAFFGKVAAPFHVVLMLDTSSSTQDKLRQIQQAAYAFVEQLQPVDRVKVISFDDQRKRLERVHQQSRNSAARDRQHALGSRERKFTTQSSWP